MFLSNWTLSLNTKQVGAITPMITLTDSVVNGQEDSAEQFFFTLISGASQGISFLRGDTLVISADHTLDIQVNGATSHFSAQHLLIDGAATSLNAVVITNNQPVNVLGQVVIMGS